MTAKIEASAPLRVDLAGGWTDVGPYPTDFGGEVVNFAINLRVIAKIMDGHIEDGIEYEFPAPRGSGLGTSSAMNVASAALMHPEEAGKPEALAERAFLTESLEGNLCGRQDQWASAFGGFNHLLFIGNSVEMMPFEPMNSAKNWLKRHLIIAFSGESRRSGEMQELVWGRYSDGDMGVIEGLNIIRGSAREMASGLQKDRRDLVVKSLRNVCEGVDLIDKSIHEPFREALDPLVSNGTVAAWKALGAGGGGCVAILCSQNGLGELKHSIEAFDWDIIEWDYEDQGVQLSG